MGAAAAGQLRARAVLGREVGARRLGRRRGRILVQVQILGPGSKVVTAARPSQSLASVLHRRVAGPRGARRSVVPRLVPILIPVPVLFPILVMRMVRARLVGARLILAVVRFAFPHVPAVPQGRLTSALVQEPETFVKDQDFSRWLLCV